VVTTDMRPDWLSPSEAARALRVSVSRIRQLTVVEQRLRYMSTPLGKLIAADDVARLASERCEQQVEADARAD
jgi:hypothetical protein